MILWRVTDPFPTDVRWPVSEHVNVVYKRAQVTSICSYFSSDLYSRSIEPQTQHCTKIMKPPQSLPLQMAERLPGVQLDSVANHVTARSIGDGRALTWLATATGWTRSTVNVPPFAVVSLSVPTWFHTTWIGRTASRLYMCKSVDRTQHLWRCYFVMEM